MLLTPFCKVLRGLTGANGDGIAKTIARDGVISFVVATIGLLLGFLTHVLLSRTLGVDEYGRYVIAVGWVLLVASLSTGGMDYSVLRFGPPLFDAGAVVALRRLVWDVATIVCATTALSMILFVVGEAVWPTMFGIQGHTQSVWFALLLASTACLTTYSAFFRAAQHIFESQAYQQLVRSLLLLAGVGIAALAGCRLDAGSALAATAVAALLALVGLGIHLRAMLMDRQDRQAVPDEAVPLRELLGMGGVTVLGSLLQQAIVLGNVVFLGMLSTVDQAGLYAAASRLSVFVTFGLSALASITAPMIATAYSGGDFARLQRIATVNARLATGSALLVSLTFAVLGQQLLNLFGHGFSAAYPVLLLLLVGGLTASAAGAAANLLLMTGRHGDVLLSLSVAAIALVIVNWLATPAYGAIGATLASVCACLVSNGLMAQFVLRRLDIDPTVFRIFAKYKRMS